MAPAAYRGGGHLCIGHIRNDPGAAAKIILAAAPYPLSFLLSASRAPFVYLALDLFNDLIVTCGLELFHKLAV